MFQSKVSTFLKNVVSKAQYDVGSTNSVLCRLFSGAAPVADAVSTEKYVPDKLYKKIELELRANDRAVLRSYGIFTAMTAKHLNVTITKNGSPLKPDFDRWTVLKSVHIYKKHRVQYEIRTYYRFIHFEKLTGSTADTLLEYLQRNLPEGVAMKVTKTEFNRLPESVEQANQSPVEQACH